MAIITINNASKYFGDIDSTIAFLNNEVKNDSWNKQFIVHAVPTLDDVNGCEDLCHEVERINRVYNVNVRMAY